MRTATTAAAIAKRAKDPEPEVRQRQADQRGDRADADDQRGADQVGEPLERDRGGGVARADAIGEQHHLQRFTGDAAQRQVAEGLGGEPHPRQPEEADRARLRESTTTTPTSGPDATTR